MHPLSYPGLPLVESMRDDAFLAVHPLLDQASDAPEPQVGGSARFLSGATIEDRTRWLSRSHDVAFLGVADSHWFHALGLTTALREATLQRLIAFETRPEALRHFVRMRTLILASVDRVDFLERLFCVRFGTGARHALEHFRPRRRRYVHGSVRKDAYLELERSLWRGCEFDAHAFSTQTGLVAEPLSAGLHIQPTRRKRDDYVATFLCGSRQDYTWTPVTTAFGTGFLAGERRFQALRKLLAETPTYPILLDGADELDDLLLAHRFQPTWLWASDWLREEATKKDRRVARTREVIARMGGGGAPESEVDIWVHQDRRCGAWIDRRVNDWGIHHRPWSPDTESLHRVARQLRGTSGLEVVPDRTWIDRDDGISKLPNTRYCPFDAFASAHYDALHSTIFLHALVGHGVDDEAFHPVVEKARKLSPNVVIREHNPRSAHGLDRRPGLSLGALTRRHGLPSKVDFAPGVEGRDSHWIAAYR